MRQRRTLCARRASRHSLLLRVKSYYPSTLPTSTTRRSRNASLIGPLNKKTSSSPTPLQLSPMHTYRCVCGTYRFIYTHTNVHSIIPLIKTPLSLFIVCRFPNQGRPLKKLVFWSIKSVWMSLHGINEQNDQGHQGWRRTAP